MPVITALAFRLQDQHALITQLGNVLDAQEAAEHLANESDEERAMKMQQLDEAAFVAQELLEIAMMEDYGDEIGRRKMFTLIRKSEFDFTVR